MKIVIEGELEDVDKIYTGGYLPELKIGKREYYVAEDEESAGKASRKYWEDMAHDDKKEFVAIIGEERLLQWAMGENDNYGCSSLEEFLDLVETVPEEEFASYDGSPLECSAELEDAKDWEDSVLTPESADDPSIEDQRAELETELEELVDELGFAPTVAYRHN